MHYYLFNNTGTMVWGILLLMYIIVLHKELKLSNLDTSKYKKWDYEEILDWILTLENGYTLNNTYFSSFRLWFIVTINSNTFRNRQIHS